MNKNLYDIHCHAMNLSHPDLYAFIKRFRRAMIPLSIALSIPGIGTILSVILNGSPSKVKKVKDMLSILEADIGDVFCKMESDIIESKLYNNGLKIGDTQYEKFVLCPLIMDFNTGLNDESVYCVSKPKKPMEDQAVDLFNGIKKYKEKPQGQGLLQIFPFIGINPLNTYCLKGKSVYAIDLLEYFFAEFSKEDTPEERYSKVKEAFYSDKFIGSFDSIPENSFAGVKLYPPLNFNPYPDGKENINIDNEKKLLDETKRIYDFCIKKNIPVITHCSKAGRLMGGGYRVMGRDIHNNFTSPGEKWDAVLSDYNKLKLDFAHFGGSVKNGEWQRDIYNYIKSYKKNIYIDISDICHTNRDYNKLEKTIDKLCNNDATSKKNFYKHILFGSDFFINMITADSYGQYLNMFCNNDAFGVNAIQIKQKFISENPERFLFGK